MARFATMQVLAAAILFYASPLLQAYEPPLDEMITRLLGAKSGTERAIIRTRSLVFEHTASVLPPAATASVRVPGVGGDEAPPRIARERGFLQTIYWVRDRFLAVETFSEDGQPIHIYLEDGVQPISIDLSGDRAFSTWDILPPYLPFVEENREDWLEGLDRWGIQPHRVDLVRAAKGQIYYRLFESPEKSVWIDRERYLPVRINTTIDGGDSPLAMQIEFGEFLLFQYSDAPAFVFPRTTNYLLQGRLFKQTIVQSLLADPPLAIFPISRLRKQTQAYLRQKANLKTETITGAR